MKLTRAVLGLAVSWACLNLTACAGDIIDDTTEFPGAVVSISTPLDPPNVSAGDALPVVANVEGVFLLDPGVEPPVEHRTDSGFLVYTLDDEATTPLLVTAQVEASVTIPASTGEGTHTIICRVFRSDGTPTSAFDQLTFGVRRASPPPPVDTTMDTSFAQPQRPPPPTPVGLMR